MEISVGGGRECLPTQSLLPAVGLCFHTHTGALRLGDGKWPTCFTAAVTGKEKARILAWQLISGASTMCQALF